MRAGITINGAHCDFYQNTLRLESQLGRKVSLASFEIEGEETWQETRQETFRPNTAGEETNLTPFPNTGENNWEDVADIIPDELATYVRSNSYNWIRDFYNIPNHSANGTITQIKVTARCFCNLSPTRTGLKIAIKTGGTPYEGDEETLINTAWTNFTKIWTNNPNTGIAWAWNDIDNLQIGVSLRYGRPENGITSISTCTQLYIEVSYTSTGSLAIAPVSAFGGYIHPDGKQEVKIFRAPAPYENIAIAPASAMGGNSTYLDDFFGGYIGDVEPRIKGVRRTYHCVAQDYNILPAQILITKSYTTKTAKEIIVDLFTSYLSEIDTSGVAAGGSTITIAWTREFFLKVLDELADIFGRVWFISHDKKFNWLVPTAGTAPFELSDSPYLTVAIPYGEHAHSEDHSRIINKVTVVGDEAVPIVVIRTDATSYALYGRYFEDKLVDKNINTVAWAELVGDAHLTEYAFAKVSGRLVCLQEGLVVGQKVKVINSLKQLNEYYTVQGITLSMVGGLTERIEVTYGDYKPGLIDMLLSLKKLDTKEK